MSGLLRRLRRQGPATADENASPTAASSESSAAPVETPAEAGGPQRVPGEASGAQPPATEAGGAQPAPTEAGGEAGGAQPAPTEQPTVVLASTTEQPAAAAEPTTAWTMASGQSAAPAQPLPAWTVATGQPTAFAAQPAPARDLPAGVDPGDLAAAPPASARRGKLRRRLRYLRHVRELLLRDLGGFTYEIHRTAAGTAQDPQRRLTEAKAERISALDAEVLALESRLGEPHAEALLREPGIGGTCRECGELHASDAHFCSRCGAPLDDKARAQRAAEQPTTGSHAVVEPQPASVLWAGGPRPAPADEVEDVPEPPSAVTSQWLAGDQPTTFARPAQRDAAAAKPDEAVAAADEAKPDEPSATTDEAKIDEPVAQTDETKPDTTVATADDSTPDAAVPADEGTPDEPSATADEAKTDEPAAQTDEVKSDDPPEEAASPEPAAAEAKPKRAKPRKRGPAKPPAAQPDAPEATSGEDQPERRNFEANGRRDEDVPPPMSSGDPLASRRERGS